LGLSICAEIVRAHKGKICLLDDSMPDWTTFELRIPIATEKP
jgi:signal transduction histidine kinase